MARTRVRTGRLAGLLAAAALSVVLVSGAASGSVEGPPDGGSAGRTHVVVEGDTLWGIARGVVGPEGDPRPVVHELRELNGLGPGSTLQPGARLVVPAA